MKYEFQITKHAVIVECQGKKEDVNGFVDWLEINNITPLDIFKRSSEEYGALFRLEHKDKLAWYDPSSEGEL